MEIVPENVWELEPQKATNEEWGVLPTESPEECLKLLFPKKEKEVPVPVSSSTAKKRARND